MAGAKGKLGNLELDALPKALRRRTSFLVARLATLLHERSARALASLSLSERRYIVLCCLEELGGCSRTQLSEYMRLDRSALAGPVRELAAADLLGIEVNARDRRQDDIALTSAGKQMLARAERRLDQVEGELFGQLMVDDRARLGELALHVIARARPDQAIRVGSGAGGQRREE